MPARARRALRSNEPDMTAKQLGSDTRQARSLRHLREFIAALDRRLPQIERVGEADIAAEAASLRNKALERIAQLEAELMRAPAGR